MKAALQKKVSENHKHQVTPDSSRFAEKSLSPSLSPGYNLYIQSKPICPCGGGCPRCIQAKLNVSQPGDPYEQEADRVAEKIMRMPESMTQRQPLQVTPLIQPQVAKEKETLKAKGFVGQSPTVTPSIESYINSLRGGGQPLDPVTRAFFEPRFGHDFSRIRVHTDWKAAEVARALNSRAFTFGRDVVFGEGEYALGTSEGNMLLAHELSHAVQQKMEIPAANSFFGNIYHSPIARMPGIVIQRKQNSPLGSKQSRPNETTAESTATDIVMIYQYTVEGKTFRLTEPEFNLESARVYKKLELDFRLLEEEIIFNKQNHQEFLQNIHGWAGKISDIFGGTKPPLIKIWSGAMIPIKSGREALQSGNLELAGRQLKIAQDSFHGAQRAWNTYIDKTSGGAQKAIKTLEYTRDISFAIAIGSVAVYAAPAIAMSIVGEGAAITAGAAIGSGALVTVGGGITGAVLRGGSSAVGQAITGERISGAEVWKEVKEGAKRGTVDAASSVVGFGAGEALGLGAKGVSLGGKLIRGGLAGGASGTTGGALGSTLEGKSASEILEDTGKGAFAGMTGGALGSAASHVSTGRSTLTKYVIETLGEAGSGAASAAVTGGSLEDIEKAAITSVVSGRATAAATHPDMKITKSTKSALELDLGSHPEPQSVQERVKTATSPKALESQSTSEPVKTPALLTKEPEPLKVSQESTSPKAAPSKGIESHTLEPKLPESTGPEVPPLKKESNRSKSAKSRKGAEKEELRKLAEAEERTEKHIKLEERALKAKEIVRDNELRRARLHRVEAEEGMAPSDSVEPTISAIFLENEGIPSPLPNEPSSHARGGGLKPGERARAERLLSESLGQAHKGPVKVTRWPSKSLAKVVKKDSSGKPSIVEFKGWGKKGELINVRSVKEQKLGRVTSMEIDDINNLPREVRDKELARAMKAAGMGDWDKDLAHILTSELGGAEMPYNLEPQLQDWNRSVKGKNNRRTAEISLKEFLDAHPKDFLRLEISRKLDVLNKLLSERFCVRDKSGTSVYDVEVNTRGELTYHVAPY